MLEKYLEDRIQVINQLENWKDSIRIAAKKMIEKGYINNNYVDAMIQNVIVNGSYIIILPKIAIPHARPETGAFKTSMSLLKLNKPVIYPEDKEVSLIFILAASDNENHLGLIAELSDLLENSEVMREILKASNEKQITELLKKATI